MSHQSILALLDAELSRLRQARALLSADPVKSRRGQKSTVVPAPKPDPAASVAAPQPKPEVVPMKVRTVSRRGYSRPRKTVPAALAGALSGTVPSGPVFVSAGQLRDTQAQKQLTAPGDSVIPRETVTAEMLAQRWLRPTTG